MSDRTELVGEVSDLKGTFAEELLNRNHSHVGTAATEDSETHRVESPKGFEPIPVQGS